MMSEEMAEIMKGFEDTLDEIKEFPDKAKINALTKMVRPFHPSVARANADDAFLVLRDDEYLIVKNKRVSFIFLS
jgi:hypothetical protein